MSASQLLARLDQLGAEDWEVVGFAAVDQTVGLNVMTVLLRRWYDSLPAADISEPDWLPDPTGRNKERWWTGQHWSLRVSDGSERETMDYPRMDKGTPLPPVTVQG